MMQETILTVYLTPHYQLRNKTFLAGISFYVFLSFYGSKVIW